MTTVNIPKQMWFRILICLLFLMPVVLLFLLPGGSILTEGHWFWMLLILCFWIMFFSIGQQDEAPGSVKRSPPKRMLSPEEHPAFVRGVMNVEVATADEGWWVFKGKLLDSPDSVYQKLKFATSAGAEPLLKDDGDGGAAIYLPQSAATQLITESPIRPWVHWLLFVLTFITMTAAGGAHEGINLWREPWRYAVGLPYALGLMAILGVHELGHYFVAKRYGFRVTPPFFLPVPFALGTLGAFIQMRSTPENRKAIFDLAIAGPLAGLAIAIPALVVGLKSSTVIPEASLASGLHHGTSVGSSILFALLAKSTLNQSLDYSHLLQLSPLAFAGWLGLFITALNLLPVGQLDGGHVVQALFGQRVGSIIGSISIWSLLLLALFVWPGLMLWAILVFFVGGVGSPPLNDLTPLTAGRKWLGYVVLAILVLILMPLPHSLWGAFGIHCPYV